MPRKRMTQEEYDSRTCKEILPSGEVCGKIPHRLATRQDGVARRLAHICSRHHQDRLAKKNGVLNYTALTGPQSGYARHRKTYCENIDGRLGFKCTTNIINEETEMGTMWYGMLDVDHIDGDPSNDSAENCQTFCKCCHAYKTYISKDTSTPGRKTLKKEMKFKKSKKSSKKKIKKPTIFENLFEYG
mgnify:CR=1 FL=1